MLQVQEVKLSGLHIRAMHMKHKQLFRKLMYDRKSTYYLSLRAMVAHSVL
jgi:hypothetical protein